MNQCIEKIELEDVIEYGITKYNSNNHWAKKPDDYDDVLKQCNTSKWIDLFHNNYIKLIIDRKETIWMNDAYKIGRITGDFPNVNCRDWSSNDTYWQSMLCRLYNIIFECFILYTIRCNRGHNIY